MKPVFRIVAIVVAVILVLFGVLVAYLSFVFDPNDYRERIANEVEARTGRSLAIEGDIGLSVFPWIGIQLGRTQLGNAEGFGDTPFARVEEVELSAKLLPLLRSEIEIDRIVLNGLDLNLERNADGRTNWEDLVSGEGEEASPTEPRSPAEDAAGGIAAIVVSGIEISDSRVHFKDNAAAVEYLIEDFDLQTGEVSPGKDFPLEMGFDVVLSEPQLTGRMDVDGIANFDPDARKFVLDDLDLNFSGAGDALPDGRAEVALKGGIAVDLASENAAFENIDLHYLGVDKEAKLTGDVAANLAEELYVLEGLKLTFVGKGEDLPGGGLEATLTGSSVSANMKTGSAALNDLVLNAYGVEARTSLKGEDIATNPSFSGPLEVAQFNVRTVLDAMGVDVPETADADVLKRASLSANIAATDTSAGLHDLVVVLDDSTLSGELSVADFARQALRFDLALDAINVDRYLPEQTADDADGRQGSGGSGEQPENGNPAGAALAVLDPAVLRGLDVAGKITVGHLTVNGMDASDIAVQINAQGDVLKLEPLAASLYGGHYSGAASFDGRSDTLGVSTRNKLSGVQIGPLLTDLQGEASKLIGRAEIDSSLSARGNDVDAIKRTLSGNAGFKFLDGAVKGVNIAHYLREAQARIQGEPVPEMNEPNQTDFTEISGSAKITDGIVRNDDLDLRSPLLRVHGEGSVNLPQETIDYLVRASVVASLAGQGGAGLDQLKGVTVPIRVSGTFDQPSYTLDVQSLLSGAVKQKVQEEIDDAVQERLQEKVSPELQEKIQKGLGGLFGR